MSWKLNTEDENPLWRQYMDELEKMNPEEQRKWEVLRELPVESPFKKINEKKKLSKNGKRVVY